MRKLTIREWKAWFASALEHVSGGAPDFYHRELENVVKRALGEIASLRLAAMWPPPELRRCRDALEPIALGECTPAGDVGGCHMECAQVAREALRWHWHVKFNDWRDSRQSDGSIRHLDVGVPLYDVMPLFFWKEKDAVDYAQRLRMAIKWDTPNGVSLKALDAVNVLTSDCHDAECPSFEKQAARERDAEQFDELRRDAAKKKAAADRADEEAWRNGTRGKVR